MSSRYLLPLAVAAALAAPVAANADVAPGQSKGDWLFRVGLSQVNPTASPGLKNPLGNGVDLTADSDVSLTGTIVYMLTDHIGTELLLAWPFEHGIDAKFPGGSKQRIGYVEILPPTLNIQWYFRPGKAFNPYVGLGVNWSIFTDSELRQNALGLPSTPSSRPATRSVVTRRSARTSSCPITGSSTWTCATSASRRTWTIRNAN